MFQIPNLDRNNDNVYYPNGIQKREFCKNTFFVFVYKKELFMSTLIKLLLVSLSLIEIVMQKAHVNNMNNHVHILEEIDLIKSCI